ncbi:thiosulfate sulfurtransferase/rhodanese-like domain-containing protein 1 isoform X1 [Poecilia latipinna]|uniref:Thiosulfate sulfurtransferase like domain containing 1 n=2 Tax=Poecilia TaxID=8080 RepID=A0A087XZL2_POEFO|nr:PREDICTED: thiosulfate sulfurtransferase/rhodanese-like domain-containing protein 1 [Poecilia formosa]XP_014883608.1 PREDICTED: thiosulfate sulfurtransferase/rhodanese-like domain-containing protein 1 isoform X1 [Poecilia latipinna]
MGNTIKYEELKALIESNKDLVLIDVRSDGEVAGGRIPGAIHIPVHTLDAALSMNPDEFKDKYGVSKPPLNAPHIVFYCQSGGRSMMATRKAVQKGYTNARNYAGAYSEWSRKQRN